MRTIGKLNSLNSQFVLNPKKILSLSIFMTTYGFFYGKQTKL